jgi:hypothetical protein
MHPATAHHWLWVVMTFLEPDVQLLPRAVVQT